MENYKIIFGISAVVIGFIGYFPYVRDSLKGKTKPHTFSWLAWGLIEATVFFAQLVKGGGPGAWVTAASAAVTLFIAGIAVTRKDTEINFFDSIAFMGALIGIALWLLTNNPLLAVILVTVSDALAFIPTFRKSYHKPDEETLIEYALSALKWIIGIFALQNFNLTTALYPVSVILTNSGFVIMSLVRKHQLKAQAAAARAAEKIS